MDWGPIDLQVLYFDDTVWVSVDGSERLAVDMPTAASEVMLGFTGSTGLYWSAQHIYSAETACPTSGGTLEPGVCPDDDLATSMGDAVASGIIDQRQQLRHRAAGLRRVRGHGAGLQ